MTDRRSNSVCRVVGLRGNARDSLNHAAHLILVGSPTPSDRLLDGVRREFGNRHTRGRYGNLNRPTGFGHAHRRFADRMNKPGFNCCALYGKCAEHVANVIMNLKKPFGMWGGRCGANHPMGEDSVEAVFTFDDAVASGGEAWVNSEDDHRGDSVLRRDGFEHLLGDIKVGKHLLDIVAVLERIDQFQESPGLCFIRRDGILGNHREFR